MIVINKSRDIKDKVILNFIKFSCKSDIFEVMFPELESK